MNARKTWTIEGVDDELREKAKDVAKRNGMSLGAWLNAVIADTAEQAEPPEELPRREDLPRRPAPQQRRAEPRYDYEQDFRRSFEDDRAPLPRRRTTALRRTGSEDFENLFGALETLARRVSSAEDQARAALAAADHRLERSPREQDDYYNDDYDDISRALGSAQADLIAADDEAREALRTLISRTRTLRQGGSRNNSGDDRRFSAIASSLGQLESRLEEISQRLERGTAAKPAPDAADGGLLSTIQQRLDELAARMDKAQDEPSDKFTSSITGLEAKLEALAERIERPIQPAPGVEASLKGLEERFGELTRRLDTKAEPVQPVADPVHTERLSRIEEQLLALNTSLARPAARTPENWDEQVAWERDSETGDSDLASAIRQIAARQRSLETQLEPEHRSFNNIEDQLRSLGERFETSYRPSVGSDDIQALQRQVADLHRTIESSASETSIAAIYNEVRELSRKVDDVRATGNQDVLERIETKIAAIAQIAEQAAPREAFTALEDKVAALGRSLESSGASVDTATFERIAEHVEQVRKVVSDAMPSDAVRALQTEVRSLNVKIEELRQRPVDPAADSLRALEGRMRDIAQMLETTHSPKATEQLIADIKAQIGEATRAMAPNNAAQNSALEGQLQDLAGKVERMRGLDVDPRTLAGLESQIARLAEQMSVSDKRFKSLEHIERTIGDVFAHIDANRNSAVDAARQAASEAVRSAISEGLPQIDPKTDAVIQTLQQNLADLRNMSDASDRRTAETLVAVNETMRKVADRLALLDGASQPALRAPQQQVQQPAPAMPEAPAIQAPVMQARVADKPVAPPQPATPKDARSAIAAAREAAAKAAQIKADTAPAAAQAPTPDLPLEPGAGRPQPAPDGASAARAARTALLQQPAPVVSEQDSRESFISAARRAAQAATAEAMAKIKPRKGEEPAAPAAAGPIAKTRGIMPRKSMPPVAEPQLDDLLDNLDESPAKPPVNRRKQIVMAMATLVIILGGYQLYGDFMGASPVTPPPPAKVVVTTEPTAAEKAATQARAPQADAQTQTAAAEPPVAVKPADAIKPPEAKPPEAMPVTEVASTPLPAADTAPAQKAQTANLPPFPMTIAAPRLKAAAGNGDPRALYEVGVRMIDGRGTPRDVQAGINWLKSAGEQNHAPSLYRLANLNEKGAPGFAKNPKEAIALYEKAGALGNRKALHNVAALYASGAEGKPNYDKAFPKFQKASELGLVDSQYNLAVLYVNGLGTQQNLAEGYKWFAIAAQNGDRDAAKKRDEIGGKLDGQALVNARLAAQSFVPAAIEPAANEEVAPVGTWDDVLPARVSAGGNAQAPGQLGIPVSASRKN